MIKRYIGCIPKSRAFSLVACKSWSLQQSREPVLKLTCELLRSTSDPDQSALHNRLRPK